MCFKEHRKDINFVKLEREKSTKWLKLEDNLASLNVINSVTRTFFENCLDTWIK